jgi:hypothetical protein
MWSSVRGRRFGGGGGGRLCPGVAGRQDLNLEGVGGSLGLQKFQQRNKNHRVHARLGFFNFFKKVIFFPQKTGKKRQHGAR